MVRVEKKGMAWVLARMARHQWQDSPDLQQQFDLPDFLAWALECSMGEARQWMKALEDDDESRPKPS